MQSKQKPPIQNKVPTPTATTTAPATPAQDRRWQRTVRFNWDKGGSKGGRK